MKHEFFKESWWCAGAHAQTICGAFLRKRPRIVLRRERIETPDHDFFDVDILETNKVAAPRLLILHGLASSSEANYVRSLIKYSSEQGWNSVAMNYRGCTEELNRGKLTYHSGKTDDLETLIEWLGVRYPGEDLYIVGFSIGGNMLLKWLGERGENVPPFLKRCVAVSVPYNLKASVALLDQGFSRKIYTRNLVTSLKKKAFLKNAQFPGMVDINKLRACRTFHAFDNLITAPLNGFLDAEDYWRKCSSEYFLERIRCQTLLIHADDDPFFKSELLPREAIEKNQFLSLRLTKGGGHLGFVSGKWPLRIEPWLEETIVQFLKDANSMQKGAE